MRKRKTRLLPLALGLLLAVICLPQTALAYDPIPDLDRTCSLTLTCKYEGVEYALYRVCDVDAAANFTPTRDFERLESVIQRKIAERDWPGLTSTLTASLHGWEADGEAPAPCAWTESGRDGRAVFSELPTGLYLVVGKQKEVEPGRYYIPTDFMVCLPNWEKPDTGGAASGGQWQYDVTVVNKGSEKEGETITLAALKVWRGDGGINRPVSVTVELLRRERGTNKPFELFQTVVLDHRNNFSTIWPELDNLNYEWTIREADVPGDYEVSYTQQGASFVITNTYDPDIPKSDPDPEPPGRPDKPDEPGNPGSPGNPGGPNDPSDPPDGPPNIPGEDIDDPEPPLSKPPEEEDLDDPEPLEEEDIDDPDTPLARLPQTGVLWWPVPFLAMGGLILFVSGWALNRREYEE